MPAMRGCDELRCDAGAGAMRCCDAARQTVMSVMSVVIIRYESYTGNRLQTAIFGENSGSAKQEFSSH
jgi:hypothetical protein